VWIALGDRAAWVPGVGLLAFAPQPPSLPGSGQEVAAIRRLAGPNAQVLTGSSATESAFRRLASTQRVLHLATYGVLNKQNPLFSFVQLAPDGAAVAVAQRAMSRRRRRRIRFTGRGLSWLKEATVSEQARGGSPSDYPCVI